MDPCPDNNPSIPLPYFCPEVVHAEGIDYVKNPKCDLDNDKSIIPSLFNTPDNGTSLPHLDERLGDHRSTSNSEDNESDESQEIVLTIPSNPSTEDKTNPHMSGRNLLIQPPSESSGSKKSDIPGDASSDDTASIDLTDRAHSDKLLLENMRHTYNQESVPGHHRLTRCTCTSCWAENIHMMSRYSLEPTTETTYHATRIANKCDYPRPKKCVKFTEKLKTLTYDVWGGQVFDYEEGKTDLTCVHKPVGFMRTTNVPEANHEEMFKR